MKKVQKPDELWQQQLSPESYRVARCGGTEAPFSGQYNHCKDPGVYHCICCGQKLFDATHKYDSGSGWPSYWQPITPDAVAEHTDHSHGMTRTEVTCSACDAHLGHVFSDGPEPTGLRYCMNSASLQLEPEES